MVHGLLLAKQRSDVARPHLCRLSRSVYAGPSGRAEMLSNMLSVVALCLSGSRTTYDQTHETVDSGVNELHITGSQDLDHAGQQYSVTE